MATTTMSVTSIEWTDRVWNPTRGCSRVSEGCRNCYAERQAIRQSAPLKPYHGLVRSTSSGPRWTGKVILDEKRLADPRRWPASRIFVNSMSDLFHEALSDAEIDQVFAVMAVHSKHTYQILTKRAERMRSYLSAPGRSEAWSWAIKSRRDAKTITGVTPEWLSQYAKRIWLGVSVEDQKTADERIPLLLQTPAAVRWVSYEPALGPVDFRMIRHNGRWVDAVTRVKGMRFDGDALDWIVLGGESGPGARPFDLAWARSTVAQCKAAGVPVFVKQLGAKPFIATAPDSSIRKTPWVLRFKSRKGGDMSEWPEDLRVREFPSVAA